MPTASSRRAEQHAAEEELRAGRAGVLGPVADPDVGDLASRPSRCAPGRRGPRRDTSRDAARSRTAAGPTPASPVQPRCTTRSWNSRVCGGRFVRSRRPGRRVGERDGDIQADRRVDLRLRADAGRQVEALHQRRLELPGQAVVADADRLLQDALDVLAPARLVDRRQPGMLLGRELLDVLLRARTSRARSACRARLKCWSSAEMSPALASPSPPAPATTSARPSNTTLPIRSPCPIARPLRPMSVEPSGPALYCAGNSRGTAFRAVG